MALNNEIDNFNLSSLLDEASSTPKDELESVVNIDMNLISADENQVRTASNDGYSEDEINALAGSINQNGLLQPIIVRKVADDNFVIVMGERRYRACKKLGMTHIPAIVRQYDDNDIRQRKIHQLIENYQRKDLDVIEVAKCLNELIESGLSSGDIAQRLGMIQSRVSMYLRVADFPKPLLEFYYKGRLSKSLRILYDLVLTYRSFPEGTLDFVNKALADKEVFDNSDLKLLKIYLKELESNSSDYQIGDPEKEDVQSENNSELKKGEDPQNEALDNKERQDPEPSFDEHIQDPENDENESDSDDNAQDESSEDLDEDIQENEESLENDQSDLDETPSDLSTVPFLNDPEEDQTQNQQNSEQGQAQEESSDDLLDENAPAIGFKVEYQGEMYTLNFADLKQTDCNMALIKSLATGESQEVCLTDLHLISYF